MKLLGQTVVLIPYFDHVGMKQWLRLSFNGEMSHKFMYRRITAFIKSEFNKTVSKQWIKRSCPVLNDRRDERTGKLKRKQITDNDAFESMINDWIRRIEDETEDKSDTILQAEDTRTPEEPVRPVPDTTA